MSRKILVTLILILLLLLPLSLVSAKGPGSGGGGGGGHPGEESAGNNLSFPVIAVDGFGITTLSETTFLVPYTGEYPGLTDEQKAYVAANGPWYPQKTEGNVWQADFVSKTSESVTFINWGDNIESVNPKLRRPFRLEVTLFKTLDSPMTAYTMAELEYPSSSNELQGTNTNTYESNYATVVSNKPEFVVQYLGNEIPTDLTWDVSRWVTGDGTYPPIVSGFGFAPELNVGGKYIFGASTGGWKPDSVGFYRLTFFIPAGSGIDLSGAVIDNFPPAVSTEADEGGVATPVVMGDLNLTYVDVEVISGGGGGRP